MSEDLTKKLPQSDSEKIALILSTVQAVSARVENISGELRETRNSIRDTGGKISVLNETLISIQIDYRDIYEDVRGLELNRNPPNSST